MSEETKIVALSPVDALDLKDRLDKVIGLLESEGKYLSRKSAAALLDMHPNAFGKLAKEEGFTRYRSGERGVRYKESELRAWLEARRV